MRAARRPLIERVRLATRSFRQRFGTLRGSILWLELLKEKLLAPGEHLRVHVPGVSQALVLRAHTSDVECLCQIFVHGELDVPYPATVRYVVDAGANIGLASVYLGHRFPLANIDALEVDLGNLELLRLNTRTLPNVKVVPKGLWSHACVLRIVNPNDEPWSFRVAETDAQDPQGIPAVSVADLMAARDVDRVDVVKIDIEGSEKEVFEAGSAWLGLTGMLLVELHDRFKPGCEAAVNAACASLTHERLLSGEYHVFRFATAEGR